MPGLFVKPLFILYPELIIQYGPPPKPIHVPGTDTRGIINFYSAPLNLQPDNA